MFPFRELSVGHLVEKLGILKCIYGFIFGAYDLHGYIRRRVILEHIDLNVEKTLEVGTSRGAWLFEVSKQQKKLGIDRSRSILKGVDISAEDIKHANKVKTCFEFDNCTFECMNVEEIENESYDQVLLLDVIEHVHDDEGFLNEVISKIRGGGDAHYFYSNA